MSYLFSKSHIHFIFRIKCPLAVCGLALSTVSLAAFYVDVSVCIVLIAIFCLIPLLLKLNFKSIIIAPIFLAFLFSLLSANNKIEKINSYSEKCIEVRFTVTQAPKETKYGFSTEVKLTSGDFKNTNCILYSENENLQVGTNYSAIIKIKPIKNYRASRYAENIFSSASLYSNPEITGTNRFTVITNNIKNYISSQFYENLNYNEAATLNALTVGEKQGFSEEFSLCVRRAGVSHVMVVSGLHLSIIMGGINLLLDRICRNTAIRTLFSFLSVFILMALCGFTMSVIRAGITFIISAMAPLLKRRNEPINTLGATLTLVLISSPFAVFSISFILSLLSTFGIIYLTPKILSKIKDGLFKTLITPVILTVSATIMTLPVTVYKFEEISLVSPITNLLISFAVSWTLTAALIALILSAIPILDVLATPFYFFSGLFTKYINGIITFFGSNSNISLTVKNYLFSIFLIFTVTIIIIKYACNQRKYLLELKETEKKRK